MFNLHKEGTKLLASLLLVVLLFNVTIFLFANNFIWVSLVLTFGVYGIFLQFFRNPTRKLENTDTWMVYAPADGKICVIEEVLETEYFNEKRLQVSIFMSPFNVHVNRNPLSGKVTYFKYHPGKFLVAWHPKSSTENERTTIVYTNNQTSILMRQIAGALARRIKWYVSEGETVQKGDEMGFIKFGSRVDLFFPIGTSIEVSMNQIVKGNQTVIAQLPQ
jgi:phosphatidylserine decarboxylase